MAITIEGGSQSPVLARNYELPRDQHGFEAEFEARFVNEFPDADQLVYDALELIHQIGAQRQGDPRADWTLVKEFIGVKSLDIVRETNPEAAAWARFRRAHFAKLSRQYSYEEWELDDATINENDQQDVHGERVPAETVALVTGLYALTGAQVIKAIPIEDTNYQHYRLISRGFYQDRPLYFIEWRSLWKDPPADVNWLSLGVLSEHDRQINTMLIGQHSVQEVAVEVVNQALFS